MVRCAGVHHATVSSALLFARRHDRNGQQRHEHSRSSSNSGTETQANERSRGQSTHSIPSSLLALLCSLCLSLSQFDLKNRRTFLKRCAYPSISLKDLYIGAQVSIYSRLLKVVAYGDQFTTAKLTVVKGRSIALVKPAGYESWGRIITAITSNGFKLGRLKTLRLSPAQAQQFYGDKSPSHRAMELAQGVVLALEIIGAGVQQALLDASQPQGSNASLDARELGSALRDVHVASSERHAESELDFLFNNPALQTTATFTNCTLAVIKPHALSAGLAGNIVDSILRLGFDISAMELFTLDKTAAEEFLEVTHTSSTRMHAQEGIQWGLLVRASALISVICSVCACLRVR